MTPANDNVKLLQGDCLELMKALPDASIDLILCDLPYGTTACKWDSVIPFDAMWAHSCCAARRRERQPAFHRRSVTQTRRDAQVGFVG